MTTANSASIMRGVPGRLSWNGTAIGTTRAMTFEPNVRLGDVWAEELGSPVDRIYGGEYPIFRAILRYNDTTAITAIAPHSSGSGGFNFIPLASSSNTRAGTSLYTVAGSLVFTPIVTTHPTITMSKAIPCWDEAAAIQHARNVEWGLAVVFLGVPDSNGKCYQYG